ncbi:hypothetical protein PFISCL1PPCAC_22615, partial [Pristionchus fissidentatus]
LPRPLALCECIGQIIVRTLTEGVIGEDSKKKKPLPYCRMCDAVFNDFDSFYAHIQTDAHIERKKHDSLLLFDEPEAKLTKNQVVAREFMGIARMKQEKEHMPEGKRTSLNAQEIVEYRLKRRPCAECSRIWEEYGSLLERNEDTAIEFAFRSHPLHPCVALVSIVLEILKTHLQIGSDMAMKPSSARLTKFPTKEVLKQLANDLSAVISVPLELGSRHAVTCTGNFQVAMHCHAD